MDVKVKGIFSIGEAFFEDRGHHAIFFTFRGEITGGTLHISRPEEIDEVIWMDAREAEKYIHITNETEPSIKSITSVPYFLREKS